MAVEKIGVLCGYAFPEGMAATIRILTYCKGLESNGVETEVYSFYKKVGSSVKPIEGLAQGIKYYSTYISDGKPGLVHSVKEKIGMVRNTMKIIKRSNNDKPLDYIFLSFDSLLFFSVFAPRIRRLGIKCLFIADEFPMPFRQLKNDLPWWQYHAYRLILKKMDKYVFMTEALSGFYNGRICTKPTHILSSIIDASRFDVCSDVQTFGCSDYPKIQKSERPVIPPYFCYMGNMELAKDDVCTIIKAFAIFYKEHPEYELRLYGKPKNNKDKNIMKETIEKNNLVGKVRLMGRVDYNQVPSVLSNASILVTAQPNTKRAEGGFPTKMAEYMMSKRPMLVTDVGEIHCYVSDGVTTFMVPPESPELYAAKLKYIVENPEEAETVSNNAYNYAVEHFEAKNVTKGLVSFLGEPL